MTIDLVFTGEPVMDEATGEQKWPPASALTVALPTTSPMDRAEVRMVCVDSMRLLTATNPLFSLVVCRLVIGAG